jgi:hypothetical protein
MNNCIGAFWRGGRILGIFSPKTLRSASPLPFSSDFLTSLQDEGSDQHYFQNEAVREVLVEKRGETKDEARSFRCRRRWHYSSF